LKKKVCKTAISVRSAKAGSGANHGASVSIASKNKSSPLMLPKRRKDSETTRERCEMTSTGNIIGARNLFGPMKCPKYLKKPFSLLIKLS